MSPVEKVWKQNDLTKVLEMLPFLSAQILSHRLSVEFMDEAGVPRIRDEDIKPRTRTRRSLDECPLRGYADIPNHDATLASEEAQDKANKADRNAAADAQKAQDKADKKAAAAAQKAAADVQKVTSDRRRGVMGVGGSTTRRARTWISTFSGFRMSGKATTRDIRFSTCAST
jgi:hypothetical protein